MQTREAATLQTVADLLDALGGIPPERIRLHPAPGTATEEDVLEAERTEDRLCELIDGVLVEKGMGYRESLIACVLIEMLRQFVTGRNLGLVSGEAGMMRLFAGRVRIPDVAFTSWERFPGKKLPTAPIPPIVPDLAIEVLSASNTAREMELKVREYLDAGVHLVWLVDLPSRSVAVHAASGTSRRLTAADSLDGESVLPGFQAPVAELFAPLDAAQG